MSSDPLLAHVRALLSTRIDSVAQLELLLFMYRRREHPWTAAEASGEFRISPDWTAEQLQRLTERGLLRREDDRFQYAASPNLDAAVGDLAQAYRMFPVTVVSAIYSPASPRSEGLRHFSDAFRLRRDPGAGEAGKDSPRG